jgi:predicted aspartyl protease
VDSGASYTLLPEKIWKALKLRPIRKVTFTLADGTTIKRKISEVRIEYKGLYGTTPVILGEEKDEALFGIFTLETLGLVLNPFTRELVPMKMMLAKMRNRKKGVFIEKTIKCFAVILFAVLCVGVAGIAEEITLTTYYPAPYGVYEELGVDNNDGRQFRTTTWADMSANSSGYGLFAGNAYVMYDGANRFRYSNTHGSIGAIGFAVNYPLWNKASIISSGTTSATADNNFTPSVIATFEYDGNVGIATTDPNYKLDVTGTVNATSYSVGGTPGAGAGDTFRSQDGKTVTVTNGIITSII